MKKTLNHYPSLAEPAQPFVHLVRQLTLPEFESLRKPPVGLLAAILPFLEGLKVGEGVLLDMPHKDAVRVSGMYENILQRLGWQGVRAKIVFNDGKEVVAVMHTE